MQEPTLAAVLADLVHPDKNVRIGTALEVGKRADAAALPVLLERLGAEPDFFVRENVTWAIVRIGADAVMPLVALLESGDLSSQFNAAHALSKLADARAVPVLLLTLDHAHEPLVQKAVFALGRIGDDVALPALLARIASGSRELRSTVNDALVAFGGRVVGPVAALLPNAPVAHRLEIIEVLAPLEGDESIQHLTDLLRDADADVRFASVNALRTRSGERAAAALRSVEADSDARVRMLALRGLDAPRAPRSAARRMHRM